MSSKALKIALAASVALNLFAIAAGTTVLVTRAKVEERIESQRTSRERSFSTLISRLSPEQQQRVRQTLKASALAAKPDFEEARAKRRQAVQLSAAPEFNAAQVHGLLEQSRAAELRGRARLEADAIRLFGTLGPADRQVLSEILSRRGRSSAKDHPPAGSDHKSSER